jgi:hypothetical protein
LEARAAAALIRQKEELLRKGNTLEAWPRIELGCADLQSAASPLRHQAVARGGSLTEATCPGKERGEE